MFPVRASDRGRLPHSSYTTRRGHDRICGGHRDAAGAEFDHFHAAPKPDAEQSWLICRPCHGSLATGKIARDEQERTGGVGW
jgi:hypothetical protein